MSQVTMKECKVEVLPASTSELFENIRSVVFVEGEQEAMYTHCLCVCFYQFRRMWLSHLIEESPIRGKAT